MEHSSKDTDKYLEKLGTLTKTKAFLGKEFLTWLWYQAELRKEAFFLERSKDKGDLSFHFWIDDRIFLQPFDKQGHENLLRGGDPSQSEEAATSLASGMVIKEFKLGMNIRGVGDFTAVLNADDLNPKSLQVPGDQAGVWEDSDELDQSTIILTRIHQMECFTDALDFVFAEFLHDRTSGDWDTKTLRSIRNWISSRRTRSAQKVIH
ncbi:MAG: hypothetical protein AB8G05_14635 [Oligoflexales bacterium]